MITNILDVLNEIEDFNYSPINKALISHLYGLIMYSNDKLKGEALELMEKSKEIKNKFYTSESLFYLNLSALDLESDLNENIGDEINELLEKSDIKI